EGDRAGDRHECLAGVAVAQPAVGPVEQPPVWMIEENALLSRPQRSQLTAALHVPDRADQLPALNAPRQELRAVRAERHVANRAIAGDAVQLLAAAGFTQPQLAFLI